MAYLLAHTDPAWRAEPDAHIWDCWRFHGETDFVRDTNGYLSQTFTHHAYESHIDLWSDFHYFSYEWRFMPTSLRAYHLRRKLNLQRLPTASF